MHIKLLRLRVRYLWRQIMDDLGLPEGTMFVDDHILCSSAYYDRYQQAINELAKYVIQ